MLAESTPKEFQLLTNTTFHVKAKHLVPNPSRHHFRSFHSKIYDSSNAKGQILFAIPFPILFVCVTFILLLFVRSLNALLDPHLFRNFTKLSSIYRFCENICLTLLYRFCSHSKFSRGVKTHSV